MSAPGSPQHNSSSVQVCSMRCVLCGGPFRPPTQVDSVAAGLTAPPSSFKWLGSWYSMAAAADTRRRGEPPFFFSHKDCTRLLQQKLDLIPEHSHIWPFVKEQTAASASMPDSLPPASYLGIADVLDPGATRTSLTMLAPSFTADDSWMLHSPLVCTENAGRILTIWQPKLERQALSLVQRLQSLLLNQGNAFRASSPRTPATSSGGATAAAGLLTAAAAASTDAPPDLLAVLLANRALHEPAILAKLHLTSHYMATRIAIAVPKEGGLPLFFESCSTAAIISLSLWLRQHAGLLASLKVGVSVCCCREDEAAADTALADALVAAAAHAPQLHMLSFSTTYSRTQLLSPRSRGMPCLQHLTHLSVPDLATEAQIRCLPARLCSLEVTKSTANVAKLQLISQQCPQLQEARLFYDLWPSRTNIGSFLLDQALNGWVLLPLVELRFIGCRLPRSYTAESPYEPPYMSRAALAQLVNLPKLTRLMFDGCCVDAPMAQFAAVMRKLRALKTLDLADPSGVLTAEEPGVPRCFVDSTSALLKAAK